MEILNGKTGHLILFCQTVRCHWLTVLKWQDDPSQEAETGLTPTQLLQSQQTHTGTGNVLPVGMDGYIPKPVETKELETS